MISVVVVENASDEDVNVVESNVAGVAEKMAVVVAEAVEDEAVEVKVATEEVEVKVAAVEEVMVAKEAMVVMLKAAVTETGTAAMRKAAAAKVLSAAVALSKEEMGKADPQRDLDLVARRCSRQRQEFHLLQVNEQKILRTV